MFDADRTITNPYVKETVSIIQPVISFAFMIEALFRVIAMGLVCNKHAYLKDAFNIFDMVIIITIFVAFLGRVLLGENQVKDIRVMATFAKVFRTLRPLRLVKAAKLRYTVESLVGAVPNLFNALLLNILVLYVFSVLGVQMFCGRISFCSDGSEKNKTECLNSTLTTANYTWDTPPQNFNNIFESLLTFFEIETLEDWQIPAFNAMDSSTE